MREESDETERMGEGGNGGGKREEGVVMIEGE